jgi:hypothetical protein
MGAFLYVFWMYWVHFTIIFSGGTIMNWLWGLGGVILALLLVLLLAVFLLVLLFPIRGHLQIYKTQQDDHILLEVRLFAGMIKIKREIPFVKLEASFRRILIKSNVKKKTVVGAGGQAGMQQTVQQDDQNPALTILTIDKIQHWYHLYQSMKDELKRMSPLILRFVKTIKVDGLTWTTVVGADEAPEAGVLAGVLWALKGCAVGMLYHYLTVVQTPSISVQPSFNGKTLHTQVNCIFHIWVGQAIGAGFKLGVFMLREGLPWQNIRSKG